MQPIIDFLHKCRAWAEQNGMGNEEAALAAAIRGLTHIVHLDAGFIHRWNPETGDVAEHDPDHPEITLGTTGPIPGVAKDNLYNSVKLSSHSPTFSSDIPDPARAALAHKRVGDADDVAVTGDKEAGEGIDPAKANPVEVQAESNMRVMPAAPVEPAKGVTTTERDLTPEGSGPEATRSEFMTGTQGTRPDARSPFAPRYTSRSQAEQDGVTLPIPREETSGAT